MAVPSDFSGLQGRWIAGAQLLNAAGDQIGDGDTVGSAGFPLPDQTSNGNDLTQGTDGNRPAWRSNQLNGHAGLLFDGNNDVLLSSGTMLPFATNNAFTMFAVLRTLSLTTAGGTDQDRPGIWAGEAGGVGLNANGSTKAWRAFLDDGSAPKSVDLANDSLVIGQAHVVMMKHDSGTCYISVDGGTAATFSSGGTNPGMATAANHLAIGRNYTSAAPNRYWNGVLFDLFFYDEARTTLEIAAIVEYLQAVYGLSPVPSLRDQIRTCATSKLLDNGVQQDALADHEVPLWVALDNDPMDPAGFAHADWPHPTGLGAGSVDWRRRIMQFQSFELQPMQRVATATLYDLRRFVTTEWGRFRTGEAQSGGTAEGVAQLGQGPVRYFTRSSSAWVDSPADDGSVVLVDVGVMALDVHGLLIQRGRTNAQKRSSFLSGFTGLSALTGSGTRALDTVVTLFNPNDSGAPANSYKLTANSVISTTVLQAMPTTAAFGAADKVTASVDVRNASAAAPGAVALQRASDSKWWRKTDLSWQTAMVLNPTPGASGEWVRWESGTMTPGATTLTPYLAIPTTGVGGQINNFGHVQIEVGTSASSRIITEAAADSRLQDVYTTPNNADPGRSLPFAPGTFKLKAWPQWASTDPNEHYIFEAYLDANNWARLRWGGAGILLFELRANATTYTAACQATFQAGAPASFIARWCSASGEEDLPPYSIQCGVLGGAIRSTIHSSSSAIGVMGAAVAAAPYSAGTPATATLYLGSDRNGAKQIDASIDELTILPYVASLDELQLSVVNEEVETRTEAPTVHVETFDADGTWTWPDGVTSAFVVAIAGGGSGSTGLGTGGIGGVGGTIAAGYVTGTPGDPVAIVVGPADSDSSFGTDIVAVFGNATVSTGTIKWDGGLGGAQDSTCGGGGGAVATLAGPGALGADAVDPVPGVGGDNGDGEGEGGDGGISAGNGMNGQAPGGGGGGAGLAGMPGAGGVGRVTVTWTE